jgi:hypothetical protein
MGSEQSKRMAAVRRTRPIQSAPDGPDENTDCMGRPRRSKDWKKKPYWAAPSGNTMSKDALRLARFSTDTKKQKKKKSPERGSGKSRIPKLDRQHHWTQPVCAQPTAQEDALAPQTSWVGSGDMRGDREDKQQTRITLVQQRGFSRSPSCLPLQTVIPERHVNGRHKDRLSFLWFAGHPCSFDIIGRCPDLLGGEAENGRRSNERLGFVCTARTARQENEWIIFRIHI